MGILSDIEIRKIEIERGRKAFLKESERCNTPFRELSDEEYYERGRFRECFNCVDDLLHYNENIKGDVHNYNNYDYCLFNYDVILNEISLIEEDINQANKLLSSGQPNNHSSFSISLCNAYFSGRLKICEVSISGYFLCCLSVFKNELSFENVHFNECSNISFEYSVFEQGLKFECIAFNTCNQITFESSIIRTLIFNPGVTIPCKVSFKEAEIHGLCYFDDVVFEKKVNFHSTIFNLSHSQGVIFENTRFKETVDFYKAVFKNTACFYKTDFEGTVVFANVHFEKKVIFLYVNLFRNMILRDTVIVMGVNFSLMNFHGEGHLNTFRLKLINFVEDPDCPDGEDNDHYLTEHIPRVYKRATYRLLKHESIQENNSIDALKYYKDEMTSFELEMLGNRRNPNFRSDFFLIWKKGNEVNQAPIMDKLILYLNKYSSNYGIDPWRGIKFTFFTTVIGFIIFLLMLNIDCFITQRRFLEFSFSGVAITTSIRHFFQFFDLSNWDFTPFKTEIGFAYFPLLFFRILIGYGIYQTVQAFRKFGRQL